MSRTKGSHNKHKKEKPVKEKKKWGRPIKQKQHQPQNQIVNVNGKWSLARWWWRGWW
jgi:hypothetical protein